MKRVQLSNSCKNIRFPPTQNLVPLSMRSDSFIALIDIAKTLGAIRAPFDHVQATFPSADLVCFCDMLTES